MTEPPDTDRDCASATDAEHDALSAAVAYAAEPDSEKARSDVRRAIDAGLAHLAATGESAEAFLRRVLDEPEEADLSADEKRTAYLAGRSAALAIMWMRCGQHAPSAELDAFCREVDAAVRGADPFARSPR